MLIIPFTIFPIVIIQFLYKLYRQYSCMITAIKKMKDIDENTTNEIINGIFIFINIKNFNGIENYEPPKPLFNYHCRPYSNKNNDYMRNEYVRQYYRTETYNRIKRYY